MEKAQSQMKKVLMFYREEVVKELAGKYGFEVEEALVHLKSKETVGEEKRGRPVKKLKELVTKEQEVDAVVMEMLADPLESTEKKSPLDTVAEKTEKKPRAPKKKKAEAQQPEAQQPEAPAEVQAEAPAEAQAEKTEKKPRAPKKKKAEAPATEAAPAEAAPAEKTEKKPRAANKKKAEAPGADAVTKPQETAVEKKTHLGGFLFKTQETKEAVNAEVEEDEEADEYDEFEFEGKSYYRTTDNVVFDKETSRGLGTWNEEKKRIDFEVDDEEEEEE